MLYATCMVINLTPRQELDLRNIAMFLKISPEEAIDRALDRLADDLRSQHETQKAGIVATGESTININKAIVNMEVKEGQ